MRPMRGLSCVSAQPAPAVRLEGLRSPLLRPELIFKAHRAGAHDVAEAIRAQLSRRAHLVPQASQVELVHLALGLVDQDDLHHAEQVLDPLDVASADGELFRDRCDHGPAPAIQPEAGRGLKLRLKRLPELLEGAAFGAIATERVEDLARHLPHLEGVRDGRVVLRSDVLTRLAIDDGEAGNDPSFQSTLACRLGNDAGRTRPGQGPDGFGVQELWKASCRATSCHLASS